MKIDKIQELVCKLAVWVKTGSYNMQPGKMTILKSQRLEIGIILKLKIISYLRLMKMIFRGKIMLDGGYSVMYSFGPTLSLYALIFVLYTWL